MTFQNIKLNSIKLPSAIDSVLSTPLHPTGTGKTFFHSQTVANNKTFNASSTERTYSIFHYARPSLSLCFLFIVHFSHVYFSREALTQKWSRRSFPDMLLRSFVCAHKDKRASRIKSDSVSASRDEPRGSNSTFLAPGNTHTHTHPSVLCQTGIGGVTRLFACMSWNKFTPPQNSGFDGGWNQPGSLRLANMWKHTHTFFVYCWWRNENKVDTTTTTNFTTFFRARSCGLCIEK